MIKLKDLLKESYVWERKFGEKLPTLADVQRKKKLSEGKWGEYKGKYLTMPTGEESSIPGDYGRDAIVVKVDKLRDTFYIYKQKGKIYMKGGKHDAYFSNTKELVKWLNHNKAKYIGIDNR